MALPRAKSQYLSKALLASLLANQGVGRMFIPAWLMDSFWGFDEVLGAHHAFENNLDVGHKAGVISVSHHESGLGKIHGRHGWGAKVLIGRLRFNLRKESRDGRYQMKLSLFRAFSPLLSVRSLGAAGRSSIWVLLHSLIGHSHGHLVMRRCITEVR